MGFFGFRTRERPSLSAAMFELAAAEEHALGTFEVTAAMADAASVAEAAAAAAEAAAAAAEVAAAAAEEAAAAAAVTATAMAARAACGSEGAAYIL